MTLRDVVAWLSFPLLMGGFVAIAAWGLGRGFDPAIFAAGLTVTNFFVILAAEHALPRRPGTSVFRDRQSRNDWATVCCSRRWRGRSAARSRWRCSLRCPRCATRSASRPCGRAIGRSRPR